MTLMLSNLMAIKIFPNSGKEKMEQSEYLQASLDVLCFQEFSVRAQVAIGSDIVYRIA